MAATCWPPFLFTSFQSSEIQPELGLQLAMQSGFCIRSGDLTKIRTIDIQNRVGRFRMIEHIACVETEFQTRRFA